eukprot:3309983-Amphidinium_carterae.1
MDFWKCFKLLPSLLRELVCKHCPLVSGAALKEDWATARAFFCDETMCNIMCEIVSELEDSPLCT